MDSRPGRASRSGRQAGRPRGALDRESLPPEITDWVLHLRKLIDSVFPTDGDAAKALGVSTPDLSKFLAGKKAPERAFVANVHPVCDRQSGMRSNDQAHQRTDALYMRALEHLNPPVWQLLSALDKRDAAAAREQAALRNLALTRKWLNRAEDEAERLRQELQAARTESAELAAKVESLLEQVRRLEEEAVVAEAILIAQQATTAPPPPAKLDLLVVRGSGAILVLCTLTCVVAIGAALVGATLADNATPWPTRGWLAAGSSVLVAAITDGLRHKALKRLGASSNAASYGLASCLLIIAACAVPLYLLNTGIRSHQNYLEHRSEATASVTDCTKQPNASPGDHDIDTPTYKCTYTWTIAGHSYRQREVGLESEEGQKTTVLIDPANPSAMLPQKVALWSWVFAYLLAVVALALPVGALRVYRTAQNETMAALRRVQRITREAAPRKASARRQKLPL